jgi:hypothetical protein
MYATCSDGKLDPHNGEFSTMMFLTLIAGKMGFPHSIVEKSHFLVRSSWPLVRNPIHRLNSCMNRLLDEIHHLADDRGATLETIVVRMRTLNEIYHSRAPTRKNMFEESSAFYVWSFE